MRSRLLVALALPALLLASKAWAKATFTITVVDEPNIGFNDPTPASPVGGNPGKTVGEQRLKVFQTAADAWGRILESPVPIVVEASFAPLECRDGMAVAGQAAPIGVSNYSGLPSTGVYPVALANKILGKDVAPNNPDITAKFNGSLASCVDIEWYYGLDGNAGTRESNLLTTVIHELGHGLGFSDGVTATSGAFSTGKPTVFSMYMLDLTTGKHFVDMTNEERKAALVNVRKLVWDGKRTDAVAARFLAKGAPSLQVSSTPSGFTGAIGEANFGPLLGDLDSITAEVAVGTMNSSCSSVSGSFSGKTALVFSPDNCASLTAASQVQKGGGLALLFAYNQTGSPPPTALEFRSSDLARFNITIPTLAVTLNDANALKNASGIKATLSADKNRRVGADDLGHALLFASDPIQSGSTGAHWDPIVRPNLTMEPVESIIPVLYRDMERAVLWDIGWTGNCGNGAIDGDEACDDGDANSDYFPNACRLDCSKPRCGDGVVDKGEQCDPGGNGTMSDPNCDSSCHLKSGSTGGAGGNSGSSARGGSSGSGGSGGSGGKSSSSSSSGKGGSGGGNSDQGGSKGSAEGGRSGSASASSSASRSGKGSGCGCHIGGMDPQAGSAMLMAGLALGLSCCARRRTARAHAGNNKLGSRRG